jgi:hypothetical protein
METMEQLGDSPIAGEVKKVVKDLSALQTKASVAFIVNAGRLMS